MSIPITSVPEAGTPPSLVSLSYAAALRHGLTQTTESAGSQIVEAGRVLRNRIIPNLPSTSTIPQVSEFGPPKATNAISPIASLPVRSRASISGSSPNSEGTSTSQIELCRPVCNPAKQVTVTARQ